MSRFALALATVTALASITGCAASVEPVAAGDDALTSTPPTAATRSTGASATTDEHNDLGITMLVDPPTGAGWAAPALMISYKDVSRSFSGSQPLTAHLTVHYSAPDRHDNETVALRLDNTGYFEGPLFVALADIEHIEGVSISVGQGSRWDASDEHHERFYSLAGIRAEPGDAASVGPFDRIAVRGATHAAAYDAAGLELTVGIEKETFTSEEVPGYDGNGASFALVPHGTAWDRIALVAGHATVASPDHTAIAAKGIAFGVTTNMGTVWLQTPTGNVKP